MSDEAVPLHEKTGVYFMIWERSERRRVGKFSLEVIIYQENEVGEETHNFPSPTLNRNFQISIDVSASSA